MSCALWLLILSFAGSVSANESNAEKVSIQLKWQHSFQFAGYYAAIEKGFYRDEELDVSLNEIAFDKDLVKQVIAGESEYGTSDSTLLIYHLKNEPVVLVNQFFQHSPLVFLSKRDSGIISPFEMIGKKVAFNTTNIGDAPLNSLLLKTIGDLSKIKTVPSDEDSQQKFIDGKTDVFSAYSTSQPYLLKEQGIETNIINPQNYGIDFYGDNLFTTSRELSDHPERVKKMSRASIKGWQYALEHSNEIIDLIVKKYNPKLSRAYLRYEAKTTRQMIIPELIALGSVDPKRYEEVAEDYRRLGFTGNSVIDKRFFYSPANKSTAKLPFTPDEQQWIKDHPVVRVGAEKDWPPYDFVDSKGQPIGLSSDMLKLISQYSGLTFQASVADWHELLEKTKHGEIDLLPAIMHSDERERYLTFSQPYQLMLDYFFIHEDVQATDFDDLAGRTVAIPKDFVQIDTVKKQFPQLHILQVDNLMAAMQSVIERKADLLIDIHSVITYLLKKNAITTIRPFKMMPPGEAEKMRMAVRKDSPLLASIIDKTLAAIPSAEKQQIEDKWLDSVSKTGTKPVYISSSEQKWLADHPLIRFSGDPKWLPYEAFDSSGRYIGIVSEYLKLIEQKLQIKLEMIPTQSWAESVSKIKNGSIDVISETVDSDLNKQLVFTKAYLASPVVIVMRDEEVYVDSIAQISTRRIALIKQYGYNPVILQQYPDIKFSEVDNVNEGLTAVSTGKIDALLCTLAQASFHISEQGMNNIRIVGKTQFSTQLGFGMTPAFAPLVPLFNRALDAISPSEQQQILENWGEKQFVEKLDYRLITKIIGTFIVILVIISFWTRRLINEIQKRKLSEQKVLLLNERFALAANIVSLGVWELGMGDNPSFWFDDKTFEIYGMPKSSSVPFSAWLKLVHPEDQALIHGLIENMKTGHSPAHIEFRIIIPGQGVRTIYCGASGINENGRLAKITGVNWDISDRKKTEIALEKAKEQAEKANHAKSQFLANMSHEIRTPLNAIIGFTELLNEQVKEPKLVSFVQTIQNAGQSLLALINDILDLSKIEAGKMQIAKTVCNPHDLFTELSQVFMMKMREKNLDFILDIDPKIPKNLTLDSVRLRQVLFNLIGNAVKFTESGYIRLKARSTSNENNIHSKLDLYIDVEDSGIGIDATQQQLVFKDFEQSEGQDYRKYGGTGLGLAISKRLVEMMGGAISVSSQLGVGSTFTVKLCDVDIASLAIDSPPAAPAAHAKIQLDPAVVLIVDDVDNNRSLLKESLADTLLTLLEAKNGLEAVNLAKANTIDLILMDIRMPVMDGYQAAEQIKSFTDTPIIALTASVMRDEYERLKSSDFDGYLRKPVLKADLIAELVRFLAYSKIDEEQDREAFFQLSPDEKIHLPATLEKMRQLEHTCLQNLKNNNISEIQKFAETLTTLGEAYRIPVLDEFTRQLREHIDCFDIIAIQRQLNDYPHFIKRLADAAAR